MVIRTSFTKATYLSKVYLDINPYSVLFYCYNDTAPNFRQPFGPLSYFEVASKAILVGPGHLEACRSIKGCDGFMMNTVFFVKQFPRACTRFELRYTTNYSRDASDTIPVNASTIEPGFSLAFFKPPAAPQTGQASTGKIRAMAGAPDEAVLIGESEVQVMIFNITADKIAAAHTEDDTTTAESWALYGTLIAVGVVFIVVAAGAVVYHSSRTPGSYPASRDDEEAATTAGRLQERQRLNEERKKSGRGY
jgi:hypothetical protein